MKYYKSFFLFFAICLHTCNVFASVVGQDNTENGRIINIGSTPSGVSVSVDGFYLGDTPFSCWVSFGNHLIKVGQESCCKKMQIKVSEYSKTDYFFDLEATAGSTTAMSNINFSDLGFEVVFVEGGSFTMGCTYEQGKDCDNDERPAKRMMIAPFYIGKYEVTQRQWRMVMGENPSHFNSCDDCPVENVSWDDIQSFFNKLKELTGKSFRLPTEAEWEYAARGGRNMKATKYSGSNYVDNVAWYTKNSVTTTHPVGQNQPNELGIYDMSGNVYEWCFDNYTIYNTAVDRRSQSLRVARGGSWKAYPWNNRVSSRYFGDQRCRNHDYGFRVAWNF
jgi:formylglycine-generating enzyme required for sulfatase activity